MDAVACLHIVQVIAYCPLPDTEPNQTKLLWQLGVVRDVRAGQGGGGGGGKEEEGEYHYS